MTIPYVIILSDSEDEYDFAPTTTVILSDSDEESHHSEHTEEEDPEEEDPELGETVPETPPPSPPTFWTHFGHFGGAHTIRTARKRVAIPRQQATPLPETTIPNTDPYFNPTEPAPEYHQHHNRNWTWIADTLQTWREEEGFPTNTEVGESSTAHQEHPYTGEPPHHSIPPMVARVSRQETRIEFIENALEEMPGAETYEELQEQVTSLGHHVEGIRDVTENLIQRGEETVNDISVLEDHLVLTRDGVEDLRERMATSTRKTVDLEQRMDHLEHNMDQFHSIAATLRGLESYISACDITPKKKGQ